MGTPGRLLDLIRRKALELEKIKILCIDEADEMMSRGFHPQIMKGGPKSEVCSKNELNLRNGVCSV